MIKKTAALLRSIVIVLTILFSLFTLTLTTPASVYAQECEPGLPPTDAEAVDKINKCAIEKNVFDDKIFNLNQIAGTTDSLYNLLTGRSRLHPETNDVTASSGALSASSHLVAALYSQPPASGVQYF